MNEAVTPTDALIQFYNEHCRDKGLTLASLEVILALINEIQELKKKKDNTYEK